MKKNIILSSLQNYYENNERLSFYSKCIDKINELPDGLIKKVINDEYILESIRITINYNIDKYHIYLYNRSKKNCTNFLVKLNNEIKDKFLYQLICTSEYNDILALANEEINIPNLSFKKKNDKNFLYFVISKSKKKFIDKNVYEFKNLYDTSSYILSIYIYDVLKYQRLDRIINFIKNDKFAKENFIRLNEFKKNLLNLDWKKRERIILFSGAIFEAIGLTYTRDIDILVLDEKNNKENSINLLKEIESMGKELEVSVLSNDNNWYTINEKIYTYKSVFFTYTLPNLVGARDIFEVMSNSKYNFFFMGIKFSSLEMNIERLLSRSNPNSLTDLIMIQKINGYKLGEKLCLPNLTVRNGKLFIFNKENIFNIYGKVKSKIKEFYNIDMTFDEIKNNIKPCKKHNYRENPHDDPDTLIIKQYHLFIRKLINDKFCLDKKNCLIINDNSDINFINSENNYKTIILNLQSIILDLDNSIKKMAEFLKPKTFIIIHSMNYNKIYSELKNNDTIEFRNEEEPIFAIANYNVGEINKNKKIVVFLKGKYEMPIGDIEYIIDINKLIDILKENNIILIKKKNYIDFDSELKNNMTESQKNINKYYSYLEFQKIQ
jgi:hypothetical protein